MTRALPCCLLFIGVILSLGCAGPEASSSFAPKAAPSVSSSLDPIVSTNLLLNNATFEPKDPPTDVKVSAEQAIKIVEAQTTGTVTASSATYGQLHDPGLGVRSDRAAWLVVLEGAARPALPGGPSPIGQRRTFAFIDAEDGRGLESFGVGAGPPGTRQP